MRPVEFLLSLCWICGSTAQEIKECKDNFLYFAYGSNLLSERIHIRNPSAQFVGIYELKGYKLDFDMFSTTWNGCVATIRESSHDSTWGVLWKLKCKDLASLDAQEGVESNHYERFTIEVVKRSGRFVENYPAYTYQLTESQLGTCSEGPSITYKDIVVAGASEHNIPLPYINFLKNIKDNGKYGGGPLANSSGHAKATSLGMGLAIVFNRMAV